MISLNDLLLKRHLLSATLLAIALFLTSCKTDEQPLTSVEKVEAAHQKEAFLANEAVQFDFLLTFGGKQRMDAKLSLSTNSVNGLLELSDSTRIYYTGDRVFCTPGLGKPSRIRFDAYTWSYFFLLPYKLSDPGAHCEPHYLTSLNEQPYTTHKLTFGENIGDAPDDWYILYTDPESHLLEVAAYIVTANKSVEEAEEDPHAIEYSDYEMIDGIPVATRWTFWGWREAEGLTDTLGEAVLTNIQFIHDTTGDLFTPPDTFTEIRLNE